MADSTTNTSATSGGAGIAEAAEAWQDVLTPGSRKAATQDTDDDQEPAQRPAKPTGKRAASKPEPDSDEESDEDEDPQADADDEVDEDGDEEDDQGEEGQESEDEESDDESDEEDGDEADSKDDTTYTVTHADGTSEDVTLEELVKGYYRQKDYTRKTQATAEERRAAQAERQEAIGLRTQYAQGLQQLQAAISEVTPQEPDWDALKASDPIGYAEAWADHQRRQHVIGQIEAERRAIAEQEQAEAQVHQREMVQRANQWLLDQIPEWKDAQKRQSDRAGMRAFALKIGFTEEELKQATDPRAVILIRQAWQYAKLQEKKGVVIKPKGKTPKSAGTKTPVLKPLAVKQPVSKQTSRLNDAKKRHAKEQSVDSAASFFRTLL